MIRFNKLPKNESIFVGFYCSILYIFISPFFTNNCFLFIFGFFKHLLGNYFRIHKLYCNIGYACKQYNKTETNDKYLIIRIMRRFMVPMLTLPLRMLILRNHNINKIIDNI